MENLSEKEQSPLSSIEHWEDDVLERYPESKDTPDAYFMKGMALKYLGRRNDAAEQFKSVIRKYPRSDRKPEAEEQLRAMGLSAGPATAAARKKK